MFDPSDRLGLGKQMATHDHDTLAVRLAEILLKLNQGESLTRVELAEEFSVAERTIYRDLSRLGRVVERRADGRYQIVAAYRGKHQTRDLEFFSKLAGIDGLFPPGVSRIVPTLMESFSQNIYLIKGQQYELVPTEGRVFYELATSIRRRVCCRFVHAGKPRIVDPYRLVNNKGIWYLAATLSGQLRAFSLSRIEALQVTDDTFVPSAEVQRTIDEEDDIWFSETKIEVVIHVAADAAYYFKRRKLVPRQEIAEARSDGSLLIRSWVSHYSQILPVVKYWIPKVRIVEPVELRDELNAQLQSYTAEL
jgi:predicted DNA-binding transcriptional regulator YafY